MCHPDSPSVCGDSYQKEGCSRLCGHWVPDTERISQAESGSLWGFRTQPLLCFHLPSPPSCSSPGRKVLTLRSTYTPHTGAGIGDTAAPLAAETPSGAPPARFPRLHSAQVLEPLLRTHRSFQRSQPWACTGGQGRKAEREGWKLQSPAACSESPLPGGVLLLKHLPGDGGDATVQGCPTEGPD